tara:strand:- start:112 stop:351 length:240 start_codon:yes stop_codon:yes gene_type:complete
MKNRFIIEYNQTTGKTMNTIKINNQEYNILNTAELRYCKMITLEGKRGAQAKLFIYENGSLKLIKGESHKKVTIKTIEM